MPMFHGVELPEGKTPWAVQSGHCGDPEDGFRVYLSKGEYTRQLSHPNCGWVCPHGIQAHWDDTWYEDFVDKAQEANP